MKLFYKTFGEGQPLLILHGLFGSADNWLTHAKNWSEHYQVFLIDQRNHGHSQHHEAMSYAHMAEDLFELIAENNLRDILLLGHSMGGKTAMTFAQEYGFLIEKMIVVDMGIRAYPPHHQTIFDGLNAVDVEHCASRQEAENRLLPFVPDASTRQFLMKNLFWKEPGKLAWRFNLPVLHREIEHIMVGLEHKICDVKSLFIRGGQSNYIKPEEFASIHALFPKSKIATVENAGHWVHAEAPAEFSDLVIDFLHNG
ncbi:MAG: hypothetical protein RLZZ262_2092 [Bacteroidota bacterium]|jgi:esterase